MVLLSKLMKYLGSISYPAFCQNQKPENHFFIVCFVLFLRFLKFCFFKAMLCLFPLNYSATSKYFFL